MNRIMIWITASLLIATIAIAGRTAELSAAPSQAVPLDAAKVSESVLWSFGGSGDGGGPSAGLLADQWGNLYGTTADGGAIDNAGTVFELSPPIGRQTQWRERVLWSFGASGDGDNPFAGLLADQWGNLYGTTDRGGLNTSCLGPLHELYGCGTVFELSLH
jgi:hypothetical protein